MIDFAKVLCPLAFVGPQAGTKKCQGLHKKGPGRSNLGWKTSHCLGGSNTYCAEKLWKHKTYPLVNKHRP